MTHAAREHYRYDTATEKPIQHQHIAQPNIINAKPT